MENQDKKLTYELGGESQEAVKGSAWESAKEFAQFIKGDGRNMAIAFVMIVINSAAGVLTPYMVALALDKYISKGNLGGLKEILIWLTVVYLITVVT